MKRDIQISITSHGHGDMILDLLSDLSNLGSCDRIQITLVINVKEDELYNTVITADYPFPVKVINNITPKGFAENQNIAFNNPVSSSDRKYFAVINPDVRIDKDVIACLVRDMELHSKVGIIAPLAVDNNGLLLDSARSFPTVMSLIRKLVLRHKGTTNLHRDVVITDWVSGMFMILPSKIYALLDGFDSRYHLYYEDVDLCARAWMSGYSVMVDSAQTVIHVGSRESRRSLKHLYWHITSMLRYLTSRRTKLARIAKNLHVLKNINIDHE